MRVAVDLTAAPDRLAGAGHYMMRLVAALCRTEAIALDLFARRVHQRDLELWAPSARRYPVGSDRRPLRLAWEQLRLPALVRRSAADLLHSPHYTMPMRAPIPVVVTFHDATFFTHPHLHERVKVRFFQWAMRGSARRARRIVTVSEASRRGILEHTGADPSRVDVVPEGVDPEQFHPPSEEEVDAFRRRHRADRPWMAFLGTLEPRKNVPRLVEAFGRIAGDWPGDLLLAGVVGWGEEDLERAIAAAPPGRVRRLGYLEDHERRALLGGAELVAYPSIAEGFGLPVLEGMACGAPVLTSATSATEEVAGGAAELVDPLDVGSIEAGMRRLLSDEDRREELRAAGPPRAARYTWEGAAASMVDVYRRALGVAFGTPPWS